MSQHSNDSRLIEPASPNSEGIPARAGVRFPLKVKVVFCVKEGKFEVVSKDVSSTGAALATPCAVRVGQPCNAMFLFKAPLTTLICSGLVVRCAYESDNHYTTSVTFMSHAFDPDGTGGTPE